MEFSKATMRALNAEIKTALEAVAEKHGLTVKCGGGSYDPAGKFKPRVEFTAENHAETEFKRSALLVGLTDADYGRTIEMSGKHFTLVGINLRARKRPVLAECVEDRKTYAFPEQIVHVLLRAVVS